MDSMDTVRERFAALEQPTEPRKPQTHALAGHTCKGERWRRWWPLAWPGAAVATLGLALALPHSVQAKTLHCDAGDVTCLIAAINADFRGAKLAHSSTHALLHFSRSMGSLSSVL